MINLFCLCKPTNDLYLPKIYGCSMFGKHCRPLVGSVHWMLFSLIYVMRDYTIWNIIRIIALSLSLTLNFYLQLAVYFLLLKLSLIVSNFKKEILCWFWCNCLWQYSLCVGAEHFYVTAMRMYVVIYQKPCNNNVFFFVREKGSIWCLGFGYGSETLCMAEAEPWRW
jgi:hypothetical protein